MFVKNNLNATVDFTTICPDVWSNVVEVKDLVQRVRHASKIITSQGEHPRVEWASENHDVLTCQSQNVDKAKILLDAFEEAFADMPNGSDKDKIGEFIKRNQILIGAKKIQFNFSKSSISSLVKNNRFNEQFDCFLAIVSDRMKKLYAQNKNTRNTDEIRIAILTCNTGHLMVANSLEAGLKNHPSKKYKNAKVINVDDLPEDPLDKATSSAVKSYQIFSKFRCQENDIPKATAYQDLRDALHHFIPSNKMHAVNRAIQEFGADVILNTVHHETNCFSPLSDLGIPVIFVNTDYELLPQLKELNDCLESDSFKVFTPIDYKQAVEGMIPVGFPIRPGFEKKFSMQEKEELRKKYNIDENESLIVFQMGSLAMGIEQNIAELIEEAKRLKRKCHFVCICANNEDAKKAIQEAQANNKNHKITLHVEGLLNDSELSLLYQTCQRENREGVFGKPGGSTSAEIAATGTFLLAYKPLPWEGPNFDYLKDRNQAKEISSFKELVKFLNGKDTKKVEDKKPPEVLDWKSNLTKEIDAIVASNRKKENDAIEDILYIKKPYSNSKIAHLFVRHCKRALRSFSSLYRFITYVMSQISSSGKTRATLKKTRATLEKSRSILGRIRSILKRIISNLKKIISNYQDSIRRLKLLWKYS